MPTRLRIFYSALNAALLFIPGVALYSELARGAGVGVDRLPWLLFYAAAIGAGVMLLLVIATGRLAYRGEREAGA